MCFASTFRGNIFDHIKFVPFPVVHGAKKTNTVVCTTGNVDVSVHGLKKTHTVVCFRWEC